MKERVKIFHAPKVTKFKKKAIGQDDEQLMSNNLMSKSVPSFFQEVVKRYSKYHQIFGKISPVNHPGLSHFRKENSGSKLPLIVLKKNIHLLPEVKGERNRF